MKRIFFLLIMMLFPINVLADTYTFDATVKINLKGKDIKEGEFTYLLKDQEGNIVKKATNDKDGKIVFKDATFEADEDYVFKLFTITPEKKNNNYNYDDNIAYIRAYIENDNAKIEYYKESIEDNVEEDNFFNRKKSDKSIYHATDEELTGQAYAVCDSDTKVMTFFRDEANKYTDQQVIDNKIYFTNLETSSYHNFNVEINNNVCKRNVKKIVFKDAIRPLNMESWFSDTNELEEIDLDKLDTSQVTSIRSLFSYSGIKKLDVSSFDTSNVIDLASAFSQMNNLEELIIDNWDVKKVNDFSSMFMNDPKLKYADIEDFILKGTGQYSSMMNLFYQSGTKYVRLQQDNEVARFASVGSMLKNMPNLEIIDLGNWKKDKYALSTTFSEIPKLRKIINHGDCFNTYPDNLYTTGEGKMGNGYGWYNIDDNTFYNFYNNSEYYNKCFPKGTYITFFDKEPEFDNVYEPIPEEEKKDNKKALITNPKTLSNILMLTTLLIIATTSTIIIKRKNRT